MRERARPTEWTREGSAKARGNVAPAPHPTRDLPARDLPDREPATPPAAPQPDPDPAVPIVVAASRTVPPEVERRNPTYGIDFWMLGLAAAVPAFLCAVALLAAAGTIPFVPPLPLGLTLGAVLVLLGVGTVFAHANAYPAWTQPGVVLLPILTLFLPTATLRGQVLTQVNGDTDRLVAAPLAVIWFLLAAATIVCAAIAAIVGRHAPSFSGMALLPAPLLLSWLLLLAPPFEERRVIIALGCALALTALTTFLGWLVPTAWRPAAPAVALGLQFILLVVLRIDLPAFSGAVRPILLLDLALLLALIGLVLTIPLCANWVRRRGWTAIERLFG